MWTMFSVVLTTISLIWVVFEIWLVIRDKIHGKGKTLKDRGTRNYNFLAFIGGIIVASIISRYHQFDFHGGWFDTVFWVGVCIMLLGFGLRVWSIATLGASFRMTVETHSGQMVVRSGPYKLVRHPSYSGLILMSFGYGIAVQNWMSLVFAVVPPIAGILYRIRVEEAALVSTIGLDYKEYRGKTKKLIPWIW